MSEQIVSFCDICNKNGDFKNISGFIVWDEKTAVKDFGWIKKEGLVICIECQEKL